MQECSRETRCKRDAAEALLAFRSDPGVAFSAFARAPRELQVARRHPGRSGSRAARTVVFASSFTRRDGAYPQLWEFMGQADFSNMPQPLKDAFLKVNPDPAKLRVMHDKDAERMRNFVDVPDELVRSVGAPTLILLGDRDIVTPEHAVALTQQIQGARLIVLPGAHGEYLGELVMTPAPSRLPEVTATVVEHFLDEASTSSAEPVPTEVARMARLREASTCTVPASGTVSFPVDRGCCGGHR